MGRVIVNLVDYDDDRQQVSFPTVDVAADGSDFGANYTAAVALNDAIAGITIGNLGVMSFQARQSGSDVGPAASPLAQTNIQWIAEYTVAGLGGTRTVRIGTADLTLVTQMYNGAPALDLTTGAGLAFKTAFENIVEVDGAGVTLNAVYYRE